MNKEELMTLPMLQGTSHCSCLLQCLEHCFLFLSCVHSCGSKPHMLDVLYTSTHRRINLLILQTVCVCAKHAEVDLGLGLVTNQTKRKPKFDTDNTRKERTYVLHRTEQVDSECGAWGPVDGGSGLGSDAKDQGETPFGSDIRFHKVGIRGRGQRGGD